MFEYKYDGASFEFVQSKEIADFRANTYKESKCKLTSIYSAEKVQTNQINLTNKFCLILIL